MKGQKYNDDIKEKAFALLSVNNNLTYVAEKLGLPRSTVKSWKENYDKKVQEGNEDTLAKVRQKKKEEFVNEAWNLITNSMSVVKKRVNRAYCLEENIDIVAECIKKKAKDIEEQTGIGWFALLDIVKELNSLKTTKLGEFSTLIGTLYDKQALANKEATSIVNGNIVTKKFEDY